MGFGDAISTCFRKYVDFNGRASRSEYWYWFLFRLLVIVGLVMVASVGRGPVGLLLAALGILAIVLPSLSVAVRRLHDINATGWLLLIGLIPTVGGLILLILACLPSTPGANNYGPGPEGQGIAEVF
jgi:uncharacterized membrane protein YhaH (DUF805 family)